MSEPLPYHCPTLNGNYLKPPCAGQIAEAKERLAKFPKAMIGFQAKCLECGGLALERRELTSIVKESDTLPENRKAMAQNGPKASSEVAKINTGPKCDDIRHTDGVNVTGRNFPDSKDSLHTAELSTCEILQTDSFDVCQNKSKNRTEIMTTQEAPTPPRCPKHPNEPQLQCRPDSKRAGQYLGSCRLCKQELVRGMNRARYDKRQEKMPPAVARDLGAVPTAKKKEQFMPEFPVQKAQEEAIVPAVKFKDEAEAERVLGPGKIAAVAPVAPEILTCTRPDCKTPGSPVKIDRLGRSMGMCVSCLSERGRQCGIESHREGRTSPPVFIPLNQPEYAELKKWLEECAQYYEQTLQKAIIFQLKRAKMMGVDRA